MTIQDKRGFTLIELLVVIAIIGILSAVVLANLSYARGKGANTGVKSNLSGVRSQAELTYDAAGISAGYSNVCTDAKVLAGLDAASIAGVGVTGSSGCGNTVNAWAAWAPLKAIESGNNRWCVDSTGNAKGELPSATLTNAVTIQCP